MKIEISAIASAQHLATGKEITDPTILQQLHTLLYTESSAAEFIDDTPLKKIGIIGGKTSLLFSPTAKSLHVLTEYHAPRELTPAELQTLVDFTLGQWNDGIGEEEFLHSKKLNLHVDISPLHQSPTLQTKQFDDGQKIPTPKRPLLADAIQEKNADLAKQLILQHTDLNTPDKYASSPLHIACLTGQLDLALLLLDHGANPSSLNHDGATPLAFLGMDNNWADHPDQSVAVAKRLLALGADLHASDKKGQSPLMWAANRNNLPLTEFLIAGGANINDNRSGSTILMYAQDVQTASLLLKLGADPSIRNDMGSNAPENALGNKHWRQSAQLAELMTPYLK